MKINHPVRLKFQNLEICNKGLWRNVSLRSDWCCSMKTTFVTIHVAYLNVFFSKLSLEGLEEALLPACANSSRGIEPS